MPEDKKLLFEQRLQALADRNTPNTQHIRSQVEEVFREEVERQKLTILGIARGKLSLIEKLMTTAHWAADILSDKNEEIFKEEFAEESLADRIKMLDSLVRSILSLTASSTIVSQLKDALLAVERTLVQEQTSTSVEMQQFKALFEQVRSIDEQRRAEDASFSIDD